MINEGDQIYKDGIAGTIHLVTDEGKLVIQWETGIIDWDVEPKDVTKIKAEQVA